MNTGTVLSCPRCGVQFRRRYVAVDFLNDERADNDRLRNALRDIACIGVGNIDDAHEMQRIANNALKEKP